MHKDINSAYAAFPDWPRKYSYFSLNYSVLRSISHGVYINSPRRILKILASSDSLGKGINIQLVTRLLQISEAQKRSLTEEESVDALAVDENTQIFDIEKRRPIREALHLLIQQDVVSKTKTIASGHPAPYWDENRNGYYVDVFYAARFWMVHEEKAEREEDEGAETAELYSPSVMLAASFLSSSNCVDNWLQVYDDEMERLRAVMLPRRYDWVPGHRSAVFHAAFHGLRRTLKLLLSKEQNTAATSFAMQEALYAACFRGRLPILQDFLRQGVSVNADYGPFETPLTAASAGGHGDIIRCLLERGATFPAELDDSHPLVVSAITGHQNAVQILTDYLSGADRQRALDYSLVTLVKRVNTNIRDNVIRVLLQVGADPLCPLEGNDQTALEIVLIRGSPTTIGLLIQASNLDKLRFCSERYLQLAVAVGEVALIQSLLSKMGPVGAERNSKFVDQARLISAVRVGSTDKVQLLLDKEPQWQGIRDRDGCSLVHVAIRESRTEIVDLLLRNMQSGEEHAPDTFRTLLFEAVRTASMDTVDIILKRIVELGLPVGVTGEHLHAAVSRGSADFFRMLLPAIPENGVLSLRDEMGKTILHTVAGAHHYTRTELRDWARPVLVALLQRNPPLEEKDSAGSTPLYHAVAMGNVEIVKMLLESGALPRNVPADEIEERRSSYADEIGLCKRLCALGSD
ncbi:hypothetical protein AJ79_02977 [Helicocarpus griseus UAMH5409]|uniref:Uncharacterized protein n=1 Tax=Helicocarpus griseus UAMH5409 TaxID=1447875 RepID=A0A2B7XRU3_9EURO|nr:hypothetical protein AJ79_02977 [Helicocarpus griseus UAMH5409]